MKVAAPLILASLFLAMTSPVQAKGTMVHLCSTKQAPGTQLRCGQKNLWHAVTTLKFLKNHPKAGNSRIRASLWVGHVWLRKYAKSQIRTARARMAPAIGHLQGWLCIHGREGSWTANTGNGFFGGLQMTDGWMGLVGQAHLLTPYQQMAAAEEGYRRSGYSSSWMSGQWPNTYPPCAGYF